MNRKYSNEDDESDEAPEVEPDYGNRFYNEAEAAERFITETKRAEKKKKAMCMVRRSLRSR